MKRFTVVLGALGMLVMFSIYCANVDFDNPIDPDNVNNFLLNELELCKVFEHDSKYDLRDANGNIISTFYDCEELKAAALAETEDAGIADILNPRSRINQVFNEDKTPTKVTVNPITWEIFEGIQGVGSYNRLTAESNWDSIGVKVEPSSPHKLEVRVEDEHGNPAVVIGGRTPIPNTYYIYYVASRTLNDGVTFFTNEARRTLIIKPAPNDDVDPPTITLLESHRNPMRVTVGNKFSDPGAAAETKYLLAPDVPITTTFQPAFSQLLSNGILKIEGGDTLAAGVGNFTIHYSAKNPSTPSQEASRTRDVIIETGDDVPLPRPVIVLPMYKFGERYGNIESVDTTFEIGGSLRLPGGHNPSGLNPGAEGVTAYYMSEGNRIDINSDKITVNYSINTGSDGTRTINYTIAATNEHAARTVTRRVFVTQNDCDVANPPPPTSELTSSFPTTITRGVSWNVNANAIWRVVSTDGEAGTYRLVGYGGLEPENPQPGTYNLRLVAIGGCGTPAGVLTPTVTVQ